MPELARRVEDDDEGRSPIPPNTVKPVEAYGKYPNQQVKGIFKEWRSNGPKADIADEHIEFIIGFEFAESVRPTKKLLIDSVLREPKLKVVYKDRFDPFTGEKIHGEFENNRYNPETGADFSDKGLHFEQGQFVEFLGNDMLWHLSTVRRIVKLAPEDWEPENEDDEPDYEYFYNIGSASLLDPRSVRAPEEGLKLVYGTRPWVWQQWASLQLEGTGRFLEDHDMDFKALSFRKNAKDLWDYWYNHSENHDFKKHVEAVESEYPGSKDKLVFHILTPFSLMDDISKSDKWDLTGKVNVYMYVSLLGSGFITGLVCLAIQFVVPILLVQAAIANSERFQDLDNLSWPVFCDRAGSYQGLLMNITVLLLYAIRVLPSLLFELFSSTGESEEPEDKVNAMRKVVWDQGDDTVSMQMGYKLNKYANGLYVSLLMTIMLFILFLTDDIFEIILNALALEFVHSLDEELASGDWFDPGGRWISVGAVELMFLITLNLEDLMDWKKFCTSFDIPLDVYSEAFGGNPKPIRNYKLGRRDAKDPRYMSQKDRYYMSAAKIARRMRNKLAVWNYTENVVTFGFPDLVFNTLGLLDTGVLCRFRSYYAWSRWRKVLFLAKVPSKNNGHWNSDCKILAANLDDPALLDDEAATRNTGNTSASGRAAKSAKNLLEGIKKKANTMAGHKGHIKFLNFDDGESDQTPIRRFISQSIDVLLFEGVFKSIGIATSRGQYMVVPFRLLDGMIEWFAYLYQLSFPAILVFFMVLILLCY